MDGLSLRWCADGSELPLPPGQHGLAPGLDGIGLHADPATASVVISVDRRGVWLEVGDVASVVHVNGRPVRRRAHLRPGDAIFVEGTELQIRAAAPPLPVASRTAVPAAAADVRIVLRGLGGDWHGRTVAVDGPLVFGAVPGVVPLLDPTTRCVQIAMEREQLVLRERGEGCSQVNGRPVREAVLAHGDQIVLDARHRLLVEMPIGEERTGIAPMPGVPLPALPVPPPSRRAAWLSLLWPLLAAVVIAVALAALLLYGNAG